MQQLPGIPLKTLPIDGLEKVCDLDYFEGPLLSHFKHLRRGDHYLFYWCERDATANRWMVLRVSETNILRLSNRFVPLDFVIPKCCQDDFVYFVDLLSSGNPDQVTLCPLQDVPVDYVPDEGAYLDEEMHSAMLASKTYSILIEQGLTAEDLSDFPKKFNQAYSVMYMAMVLQPEIIPSHPWRGGFSSMHFYRDMRDLIPGEERPSLDSVQYASPGFIRFTTLNSKVVNKLNELIERTTRSRESLTDSYDELASYIRKHKLNDITNEDDLRWKEHHRELIQLTSSLLNAIGFPNHDVILNSIQRPFEAAKITKSFVDRIRQLADYDEGGIVRFPRAYKLFV